MKDRLDLMRKDGVVSLPNPAHFYLKTNKCSPLIGALLTSIGERDNQRRASQTLLKYVVSLKLNRKFDGLFCDENVEQ